MATGLKNYTDANKLMVHIVRRLFKENKTPTEVVEILNKQNIVTPHGKPWLIGNFSRWTARHNLNFNKIVRRMKSEQRMLSPDGYSPEVNQIILEYYGKEPVRTTYKRLCDTGLRGKDGKLFSEMDTAIVSYIATKYLGLDPITSRAPLDTLFDRLRYLQGGTTQLKLKALTKEPKRIKIPKETTESRAETIETVVAETSPVPSRSRTESKLLKQVSDIMNSNLPDDTKLSLTQTLLK